jgi:hypothetical protein
MTSTRSTRNQQGGSMRVLRVRMRCASGDVLPTGWIMESKRRPGKSQKWKIDRYYVSPTGRRFNSLLSARQLVERVGGDEPSNDCASLDSKFAGILRGWIAKYEEMERFQARHGHLRVPKRSNPSLSNWMTEMWYQAKSKGPRALSSQKKRLLDEIGFDFTNQRRKSEAGLLSKCTTAPEHKNKKTTSANDSSKSLAAGISPTWNVHLAELKLFKLVHGHLRVPKRSNPSLSNWVKEMRYQAKSKGKKRAPLS